MLKQAFVLTALIAATAAGQTSAPSVTREARALWKSNIGYIVQAAEELPEAMYAYKPTPDVRSFAALFGHIAGSQKMYCAMALGDKVPDEGDVEAAEQPEGQQRLHHEPAAKRVQAEHRRQPQHDAA